MKDKRAIKREVFYFSGPLLMNSVPKKEAKFGVYRETDKHGDLVYEEFLAF